MSSSIFVPTMNTIQILYNNDYGGFRFSDEVLQSCQDANILVDELHHTIEERTNPVLIEMIAHLGSEKSSGTCGSIAIEKYIYDSRIPYDIIKGAIVIDEYDGSENVRMDHNKMIVDMIKEKHITTMSEVEEMIRIVEKQEEAYNNCYTIFESNND